MSDSEDRAEPHEHLFSDQTLDERRTRVQSGAAITVMGAIKDDGREDNCDRIVHNCSPRENRWL